MPKNIVICCDGTKNEYGPENTNVVKLYSVLEVDPARQVVYYHPGLGTMGAPNALTAPAKWWTRILGLAFGYGLSQHLADLYGFLMEQYQPEDRIFVFGFSRGAYTARALCSMLHMFGLIREDDDILIPYAVRMLKECKDVTFTVAEGFKRTFSREVKPHFVGVWDTVSSVGAFYNPVKLPFSARNPDILIGRHAVAIDERRAFYRQNLWFPLQWQDIKQVWFAGAHCDVGGGYPEPKSGLSKIALEWMVAEARAAGLLVNQHELDRILGRSGAGIARPDPAATLHNSLKWWWWAELIPRRYTSLRSAERKKKWKIPLGRRRFIADGSLIHESVSQRMKTLPCYNPPNLPTTYTIEPTR
jgi:uncharacterized protein (DUF2235 family)